MKKIFATALFFFLQTGAAFCEEVPAVNPNAPAPPSPLKVSVPHSERTKGNFLDVALDFMFVRFFNLDKNIEVTYDFFEINDARDLAFKNVRVKSLYPDATGTVVIKKALFNFSDLMKAVKSEKISTSKIVFETVSGDLKVADAGKKTAQNPSGKVLRNVKGEAERLTLKDVPLVLWGKGARPNMLGAVSGRNVVVTVSNPSERFAASSVEAKDVDFSAGKVTFSSAVVDGREYRDAPSFLKAVGKK